MSDLKTLKDKLQNTKILVVDDEEEVLDTTVEFFKKISQSVDKAKNGSQALKMHDMNKYDIIVSDARMPVMSGWELFKQLHDRNDSVFIIVMSGSTDELDENKGCCDYMLAKPIRIDKIAEVLKAYLYKKGL